MWQQITKWLKSQPTNLSQSMATLWPVDMHNHLIPSVDDGVNSLEETMQILRQYVNWGISRVIATPHISQDYYPNSSENLLRGAEKVQAAIESENLPISFSVAAEYLIDEQFEQLVKRRDILSFGSPRYVLIEMGWASAPYQLEGDLFALQQKGYTPVLAHPERYRYFHDDPNKLLSLPEKGCLFQLNLLSLSGRYGKAVTQQAQLLLKSKVINFLGSDLHHSSDLKVLPKVFTPTFINLLSQQPLLNASLL